MNNPRGNLAVVLIVGLAALASIQNGPRAEEMQLAQASPQQQQQAQERARAAAQQQQAARAAQQQAQQAARAAAAQQQAARAAAQQQQAAQAAQQQAARAAAQQQRQAQEQARAAAGAAQQQRQAQEQAARATQQRQAQERAAQQQRQAQEQAARAAQQRQAQEQARAGQERTRVQQQQQLQAQERARVEQQRRAAEQERTRAATDQQRANERRQQANEKQRAVERDAVERRRAEEQQRATERRSAPERFGQQRQPAIGQPLSVGHEQLRQERVRLSEDQRLRLRQAFPVNRDRMTRVQFTRRVGTRIPRSVTLFAVPAAVLAVFPYYRDYRYVIEDDTICVVDPDTYEIVDMLDEGPYTPGLRPQVADLTLTESETAFVLGSIPPDFPQTPLRLRLALGAEIPASVELYEFAPIVLERVPKLSDFRFVVTDDQLVIVAPQDRSVALVLDR